MGRGEVVRFERAKCIKATEMALLIEIDGNEGVWIPKSQIDDDSEVFDDEANAEGVLIVSEWIAIQKGLV